MYSVNPEIVICLDSFSKQIYNIWVLFRHIRDEDDCRVKFAKLLYFPLASFARSHWVTDEAFIAET